VFIRQANLGQRVLTGFFVLHFEVALNEIILRTRRR
jgi:hypothetical protein